MRYIGFFFLALSIILFVSATIMAFNSHGRQTTTLETYVPGTYLPPYQPCKETK